MKQVAFLTTLFAMVLVQTFAFPTDNLISISCDHYKMNIRNTSNYTLKIYAMQGSEVLAPAEITYIGRDRSDIRGRFTRHKLDNMTIHCRYDEDTYYIDSKDNEILYNERCKNLLRYTEEQMMLSLKKFIVSIAAEEATKLKKNSDDWWIERAGKDLLNFLGGTTKWTISRYDDLKTLGTNLSQFQKKTYSDDINGIKELIEDIERTIKNERDIDKDIEKVVDELFKALENSIREDSKKYYKKRTLYFGQDILDDLNFYIDKKRIIKDVFERREADIYALKRDLDFTKRNKYNALMLASKNHLDLRPYTPYWVISIDPIVKGNRLNDFWGRMPDAIFEKPSSGGDLEWSDGLWNKYFGASMGFAASPEIVFNSNKLSYGRFFITIGYNQVGYRLDSTQFRLSNNFFKTLPNNRLEKFSLSEPIRFDQTNILAGLNFRWVYDKFLMIDVTGGFLKQSGILDLSHSELSPAFTWANTNIKIVDDAYVPYYGFKLGYGVNHFHAGTHFTIGANFYKVDQNNITNYKISDNEGNAIEFKSNRLHYKLNIGLSTSF